MSAIKSELSKKNKYWIPKHRYYELKHFCLQYPEWRNLYFSLGDGSSVDLAKPRGSNESIEWRDPVYDAVVSRRYYKKCMYAVEQASKMPEDELSKFLMTAVTEGLSYTSMRMVHSIPCGREMFYKRYRRFFWILDRILRSNTQVSEI